MKKNIKEWKEEKKWNPFNSYKLLAHVERWKLIKRGEIMPPPILVTIDPSNICNFNCKWCNASYIRNKQNQQLTSKNIQDIVNFLINWKYNNYSLQAVCIAGGGEPLINENTGLLIDLLTQNSIEVGVVTNGFFIEKFVEPLSKCTWVGISIDAGSPAIFNKLKGLSSNLNAFDKVIDNIKILIDYSVKNKTKLGKKHPAYGVSYKFLLDNENIQDIFGAVKLAKTSFCKNFHLRPSSTTWDKLHSDKELSFSDEEINLYFNEISKSLELDDKTFSVYGVTHKFDSQFKRCNNFNKCYAVFMTGVFMPSQQKGKIDFGLCCDRRGDDRLLLAKGIDNPAMINELWGSDYHWQVHDKINVQTDCPRCTYQPHNQIYEQVILEDSMTYIFI